MAADCWVLAALDCWVLAVLDCWALAVLDCCYLAVLDYWTLAALDYRWARYTRRTAGTQRDSITTLLGKYGRRIARLIFAVP